VLRVLAAIMVFGVAAALQAQESGHWPQFRGPGGLGYTTEKNLPVTWGGPKGENILWKSPLVGEGHASPIVWGDRVITCTVRWAGGKPDPAVIPEHHVVAYSAADGKTLWDTTLEAGPWRREDFRSGPGGGYAAPTPCTDGKRVFVVFGSSVMAALDLEGKVAWRQEIKPFTFDVTIGSSPILHGDTVILLCAMAKASDSRLVAFAKSDGQVKWETKLPRVGFGHSTPVIVDVKGRPQLILVASGMKEMGEGLQSFDPADGKRIWWCKSAGDASSPAFGSGLVYADSGRGGNGVAVDPTGEGDVTATHVKWTVGGLPECVASPVVVGEHVFRLQSPGIVRVWKVADGSETDRQRLQGVGSTWASPVVDPDGRIFFAGGGKSYVVQAGPQIKILATNDLGDPNHASPAVANGRLFIEGLKNLYCIGAR
jgi:outer membrane protein assembly factor BamB